MDLLPEQGKRRRMEDDDADQADANLEGVKWDAFFNDPSDDTVLKTTDGVHFRASSFRLSAFSNMFQSMFESGANRDIVEVECVSEILSAFLSIVAAPAPPRMRLEDVGIYIFAGVHRLAEFFDCPSLVAYIGSETADVCSRRPRLAFRYAAFIDDVALGKNALRQMASLLHGTGLADIKTLLEGIKPSWQAAFFMASIVYNGGIGIGPAFGGPSPSARIEIQPDWVSLSMKFKPEPDEMSRTFKF